MTRLPNQSMTPGRPAKPPGLSKVASREWDRLIQDLQESGIQIAKAHGRLIEMASSVLADLEDALDTVNTEGAYFENQKTGVIQLHPAARRVDSLRRDYVKVLSLLGLRSATADGAPDKGKSLDDFLRACR